MRRKDLCTRNCTSVQRCAVLPTPATARGRRDATLCPRAVPCGVWSETSGIGMRMRIVGFFSISQRGASQAARGLHAGQPPALSAGRVGARQERSLDKKLYRGTGTCVLSVAEWRNKEEKKKRNIREGSSGAPGRARAERVRGYQIRLLKVGRLFLGVWRLIEQFTRPTRQLLFL